MDWSSTTTNLTLRVEWTSCKDLLSLLQKWSKSCARTVSETIGRRLDHLITNQWLEFSHSQCQKQRRKSFPMTNTLHRWTITSSSGLVRALLLYHITFPRKSYKQSYHKSMESISQEVALISSTRKQASSTLTTKLQRKSLSIQRKWRTKRMSNGQFWESVKVCKQFL